MWERQPLYTRTGRISQRRWDRFAVEAGCSFKSLFYYSRFSQTKFIETKRFQRFEVMADDGGTRKIAQCAIATLTSGEKVFADQLQILPEYRHLWSDAMRSVLRSAGAGSYVYGSEWVPEGCRVEALSAIATVSIKAVRPAYLELIEFSRWDSWDAYWSGVSANIRRNCKKAVSTKIETFDTCGFRELIILSRFSSLHAKLIQRKKLRPSNKFIRLKAVTRYLILLSRIAVVYSIDKARIKGYALCVDVGTNIFYLEGASRGDDGEGGWPVLMMAIHRAFVLTGGKGRFVMGPVDDATLATAGWQGLSRSRQQCRATRIPVSTVEFRYDDDPECADEARARLVAT